MSIELTASPALVRRLFRTLPATLMLAGLLGLQACAPLITQNPNEGWSPVNVKPAADTGRLLLDGFDLVTYFSPGGARVGSPEFKTTYKGVILHFASAVNKTTFEANPTAYLPQYGGYCANGIVYGIPWGGDGDSYRIYNGKLYMFGGAGSRQGFELDVRGNIALADRYWKEEIEGSNAFVQRMKRWALSRVSHYKTGPELAALVAEKEKAGK